MRFALFLLVLDIILGLIGIRSIVLDKIISGVLALASLPFLVMSLVAFFAACFAKTDSEDRARKGYGVFMFITSCIYGWIAVSNLVYIFS